MPLRPHLQLPYLLLIDAVGYIFLNNHFCFRDEVGIIRKKCAVLSVVAGMEYASTPVATLVSVVTLVLTGQPLTPSIVFMLLSFFNVARLCTCYYLAYGLLGTYEAYASLGRIENFLLLENLPAISCRDQSQEDTSNSESNSEKLKTGSNLTKRHAKMEEVSIPIGVKDKPKDLCVSGLTHKQIKRGDEFILEDIEFTTLSGTLTVITGPVGSGKSTLLSAIAGETSDVTYKGTLVYVPQIAWVFSGTIKENILFGLPYEELKYKRITEACALMEDIQQFPEADQTIVGERGVTLSGGQRARVCLARAVYADADLYLLDDPLSAVDFKVGRHIFEKCIKGLLGDKTRVLSSHHEQHMREADDVIVLYKGRVLGKGRFTDLQEQGFLNTTVDRLYKKGLIGNNADESLVGEIEEKSEDADSSGRIAATAKEYKGLEISQEDRSIGVVSSKLYWDYFRSGMHALIIVAVIGLCFIAQGKLILSLSGCNTHL